MKMLNEEGVKTGIVTVNFKADTSEFYDYNDEYKQHLHNYAEFDSGFINENDYPFQTIVHLHLNH